MENADLRAAMGMQEDQTGILVAKVAPLAPANFGLGGGDDSGVDEIDAIDVDGEEGDDDGGDGDEDNSVSSSSRTSISSSSSSSSAEPAAASDGTDRGSDSGSENALVR